MGTRSKFHEPGPDLEEQQTLLPAAADEMRLPPSDGGSCKACSCASPTAARTLALVVLAAGALFAAQLVLREEYLPLTLFASHTLSFCVLTSLLGLCVLPEGGARRRLAWAPAVAAHVLLWSFAMALMVSMTLWVVRIAPAVLGVPLLGLAMAVIFACFDELVQCMWPGKTFWWRPAPNFLRCVPGTTICRHMPELSLHGLAPDFVPSASPLLTSVRSAANEAPPRHLGLQGMRHGLQEGQDLLSLQAMAQLLAKQSWTSDTVASRVVTAAELASLPLPSLSTLPASPIMSMMSSASGKVEDAFKLFNWSDDTRITREELENCLRMLGTPVPGDELAALIACIDPDGDGCVGVEVVRELCGAIMSIKDREKREQELAEFIRKMLRLFDGDSDGSITVDEINAVLVAMGLNPRQDRTPEECQSMIGQVDRHGQGPS